MPIPSQAIPENSDFAVELIDSQPAERGIGIRLRWMGDERVIGTLNDLTVGFGQEDLRPTYTAEQGMTDYGGIRSDAAFIMIRKDLSGDWAGFINGTYLEHNDKILYKGLSHSMFQENKLDLPGVPARFRWESSS